MHLYQFIIILYILLLIIPGQSFGLHTHTQVPQSVLNLMNRYKVPKDSLSLYIVDLDHDHPLLELNPDIARNPASIIKLLTTYAGLEILGPAYKWETRFYLDGELSKETLKGNLVFQGGGDPFLTRENFWHMLHTLQLRGLRKITGDLIIDDSLFEDETGTTADFDNRPHSVYNTFPDAALVNFQAQEFVIVPQKNNVLVYADPPASNLQIRNNLQLVSGKCFASGTGVNLSTSLQGSQIIATFSGKYPSACGEQVLLRSIIPNDMYIFGVFKSLWQEMGGSIDGSYRSAALTLPDKPFYLELSKPLSEIVTYINKFSNNVMARQLFLTIGQIQNGTPGTKLSASRAINDWLVSIGINAPELVLDNGSGLSRSTRISARTMGRLLEHAWHSPLQPEFLASLPIAGLDGTMSKRLNGKIPGSRIRIKTGLLRNVRSMAGYVYSRNNRHYAIVSLQNHPGIQNTTGTLIQDELLKWLHEQ
jgi:serine-type D-Ala-D-Ala carboxypeptidase/endopeptidase (penicillin-binding protein 4)